MLSLLGCFNQSQQHKQEFARQVIAGNPQFDAKNPQHVQGLQVAISQHTFDIAIYTIAQESLLARGRNHMAAVALRQGFDKLLFIDSDEGWTWDDFVKVVSSPHPITAGVVPLKTYYDFPNTFKTSLNYLPFFEDEKYYQKAIRDVDGMEKHAEAAGSPLFKVAFTGTGFLCLDKSVLMTLAEDAPHYLYPDPSNGQVQSHWAFFDGGPINEAYFSEDWALCQKAREKGFDIYVHSEVRVTHTGNNTFKAIKYVLASDAQQTQAT